MIELQNVTKKFKKKQVLTGINLTFEQGVYGLLGPNGAGKTTLLRCMTGIYTDYSGRILYHNRELNGSISRTIGYLPQKFDMFHELKLEEMMAYFAQLNKIPKSQQRQSIQKALELVNLENSRLDRVGALSGGMIRRAGIAQAILGDPQIVIVDEPTAGLDPEERLRFKGAIARVGQERTVLLSTHIIEDVEALCDKIIIIDQGRIKFQGAMEEVAALAQGHVFIGNSSLPLPSGGVLVKQFEREGKIYSRVLALQASEDWEEDRAAVEDGYMYVIKGLRNETIST